MRKTRMTKAAQAAVLAKAQRRFGKKTTLTDRRQKVQQYLAQQGVATARNRSYMS
jgi:hypothetical protein